MTIADPLEITAGDDVTIRVGPVTNDDDGSPVSLSTVTLRLVVQESAASDDADAVISVTTASMTISSDPTNGDSVSIPLSSAQTAALAGPYAWVLKAKDASLKTRTIAAGSLDVTRRGWTGTL